MLCFISTTILMNFLTLISHITFTTSECAINIPTSAYQCVSACPNALTAFLNSGIVDLCYNTIDDILHMIGVM